jgi:hypothetical protein
MHLKVPEKELQPPQLLQWLVPPISRKDSSLELDKLLAKREVLMILHKIRRTLVEGLGKIEVPAENPKKKIPLNNRSPWSANTWQVQRTNVKQYSTKLFRTSLPL